MKTSWLIDTNVLIYSYDQTCQFHESSYSFLEHAISGHFDLYITHQNLLEFLSVSTNPRRVHYPLTIDEALQKSTIYATSFQLISPTQDTFSAFIQLLKSTSKRENIFDLYLAATALSNNLNQICTWNVKDFSKINSFVSKTPEDILNLFRKQ